MRIAANSHLINHQTGNRKRLHQTVAENTTRIAGADLIRREHEVQVLEEVENDYSRLVVEFPAGIFRKQINDV